jgi:hypothetical protein
MGQQLSFATDGPAVVVPWGDNVVPLDLRRRPSRVRPVSTVQPGVPEGVVVRLALAHRNGRPTQESAVTAKAKSLDGNEQGFTPFDYVATAFLILSVFAAPALMWALLRTASFG